jgi:adenosylhomocysteine nucleosidase
MWSGNLGNARLLICAGGMGPEKASQCTRALLQEGVSALLCVGAAGALDESLKVGDLVIAEWVLLAEGNQAPIPCDATWIERARDLADRKGFSVASGGLVSVSRPVSSPEDKARLARETNALAVDMESAAAAQAAGVPFSSLRVITDDARTALPDFRAGWKNPGRLLAQGAGFLARAGSMRRALHRLQDFASHLARDTPLLGDPLDGTAD